MLFSEKKNKYYIGSISDNLLERLRKHNSFWWLVIRRITIKYRNQY
ncbi:MAG: GIY-YIG nuclease family protein [Bacteroidetes bacterium]|nr:GIY-YIG nuclease family protein [Bacteroidota bacterium]